MKHVFLSLAMALVLSACSTLDPLTEPPRHYTGDEFYYDQSGVHYSCREPKPWRGGNCRPEAAWPDGGIDGGVDG